MTSTIVLFIVLMASALVTGIAEWRMRKAMGHTAFTKWVMASLYVLLNFMFWFVAYWQYVETFGVQLVSAAIGCILACIVAEAAWKHHCQEREAKQAEVY